MIEKQDDNHVGIPQSCLLFQDKKNSIVQNSYRLDLHFVISNKPFSLKYKVAKN